ncbi:hypothetical protein Gocc_1432 [Gaiella occulta]|uniref:Uncharacterized protein n=1 Tax=Gaiella occulta TaxID=1002870 RepID=A0A7M2YWN8_9ACTN|nr:hypothetical protein Gocc_1432 [Gaiella occulta]
MTRATPAPLFDVPPHDIAARREAIAAAAAGGSLGLAG